MSVIKCIIKELVLIAFGQEREKSTKVNKSQQKSTQVKVSQVVKLKLVKSKLLKKSQNEKG